MVADFVDSYQVALSIVEHERDCYRRAAETKKSCRARSKPIAEATFITKHSKQHIWTPYWMEAKEEFDAAEKARLTAEELAKQEEKERKAREKEQRAVSNAQRKALTTDAALQKKITKEVEAAERVREKEAQKLATQAAIQLKRANKLANKA
jgi:hypothetical protein